MKKYLSMKGTSCRGRILLKNIYDSFNIYKKTYAFLLYQAKYIIFI